MIIERTCEKTVSSRGGYAMILGIFVCLLIGMLFYYRSLVGPGIDIDTGEKIKNPPWKQWHNLQKLVEREKLGKPFPIHPKIVEKIGLLSILHEGQDERGGISLIFDSNYCIAGEWGGTYSVGPNKAKEFQIGLCKIKGHFIPYPARIKVKEEHKTDEIYFLAKGLFVMVEYNNEKGGGVRKVSGEIYVKGWLAPDFTIQRGQAVLTSDNKHFQTFTYEGKAEKIMDLEAIIKSIRQK